jgi:xanthine/CO dehydrogenase XdhC/CoxF family maturation factor
MADTGIVHDQDTDPACATAHGEAPAETSDRTLVAVFSSPVADYLLRYGADLGFRPVLVEPDAERAAQARRPDPAALKAPEVVAGAPGDLDGTADVVVTDHHREELGPVLRDLLAGKPRWIGVMGNPRHFPPHVRALTQLGVPHSDIARVHRPVGLNIGSRTPPEIAIAALAGLIADRNGRPGGFVF